MEIPAPLQAPWLLYGYIKTLEQLPPQHFQLRDLSNVTILVTSRPVVQIKGWLPVEEQSSEGLVDGSHPTDQLIPADEGELLVIRRLLNTQNQPEQEWLRHNIFRTRCTVQGKVCNLVIDSGSCEDVVSSLTVEKLTLSTKPHMQPYQLARLKKGNEISVDK